METLSNSLPMPSQSPALTWSDSEIEQLCWNAGILTLVVTHGFRKAATEGFMEHGYRLATISREFEPFDYIHKLSLYILGNQPRLGRREAKKLARSVMQKIGLPLKPDECLVEVSGRRLVVFVTVPSWARPYL